MGRKKWNQCSLSCPCRRDFSRLKTNTLHAKRIGPTLVPDRSRVLMRPFQPATTDIARRIVARVMALPEEEVARLLNRVFGEFANRHEHVEKIFSARFEQVKIYLEPDAQPLPSPEREMLIGAYFTNEYSPESAALFNPSIVPHPDQSGLSKGALRFILSLRATGEGHISSITFRVGVVSAHGSITLTPPVPFVMEPERVPNAAYVKGPRSSRSCDEMGCDNDPAAAVMEPLGEDFTRSSLNQSVERILRETRHARRRRPDALRCIRWLADSNYEVRFSPRLAMSSQRVLFPSAPSQSNGIEDARFVRFQNDDGSFNYYATYTAYDGKSRCRNCWRRRTSCISNSARSTARPCRTRAWRCSRAKSTGNTRCSRARMTRTYSDHVLRQPSFLEGAESLVAPAQPWEFFKLGNCGSPIETEAGWLVLSHGVGAMRKILPRRVPARFERPDPRHRPPARTVALPE